MVSVSSPAAMRTIGQRFAALLRPGDLVVLAGPLGAGKTTFTQGVALGLGVRSRVTSPTFVIARSYETESGFSLVHVDAYRITSALELEDVGIDEELDSVVTIVEWGGGIVDGWTNDPLTVRIDRADRGEVRTIAIDAPGPGWSNRVDALTQAFADGQL